VTGRRRPARATLAPTRGPWRGRPARGTEVWQRHTNWVAPYNIFLPFLSQMADRRASEPVVFLLASCQRDVPMPQNCKAAGECLRQAITFENVCLIARASRRAVASV
jgi:hypothetical protein